jgi:peptidyl-prolyl cis-trans isomerase D
MALIGTIRKRSGLLIGAVGVAMAAFILGDFFTGGTSSRPEYHIGDVKGNPIQGEEYDNKVQNQVESLRSIGQRIDDPATEQIKEQVWNQIVREKVLASELNSVGVQLTQGEYDDIRWGNNVLPEIKNDQTFVSKETGAFDPDAVKQYFVFVQKTYPTYFKVQKERMINNRKVQKYNNIVKAGMMVNSLEAQQDYVATNRKADLTFVVKTYASIPDSIITVADADVRNYYNKHKADKKYQQEESRSIEYISFDVSPTEDDVEDARIWLVEMTEDFISTENDSVFVTNNSDTRAYETEVYVEGTIADKDVDSKLVSSKKGEVVGPYKDGENFKLVKVLNNGKKPEVRARHILLALDATNDIAALKAKAASFKKEIKRKKNFEALAKEHSTDKGSAVKGGDLDWFGQGVMVPAFDKACFEGRKGEMRIVETQFGVHLIEITDKREKDEINLLVIKRAIEPSKSTFDDSYDIASVFSINNNNEELFFAGVDTAGYVAQKANNILPNAKNVQGLTNARSIVRWIYEAKLGDVSEPFEVGRKFVIAIVSEVKNEGEPTFEELQEVFKAAVVRENKAAMFMEKMAGFESLDALAASIGEEVKSSPGISFNSYSLQGAGREPNVIGQSATLSAGNISVPLEGASGVFVVAVDNVTEAPETNDYSVSRTTLDGKMKSAIDFGVYNALREKADVNDNRYKFY